MRDLACLVIKWKICPDLNTTILILVNILLVGQFLKLMNLKMNEPSLIMLINI